MLYTRKPPYIGFLQVSRGSTHIIPASNSTMVSVSIIFRLNVTEIGNSKERVYINNIWVSNILKIITIMLHIKILVNNELR